MDSEKHLILITRFSSGVTELCNIRTWKGFIKTIEFKFLLLRELPKIKPYHKKPWSDTPCNWQVSCSWDAQDANYLLPYEILKIACLIYWLFFFSKRTYNISLCADILGFSESSLSQITFKCVESFFFVKPTYISTSKEKEKVRNMRRINYSSSNSHPENPCLLASYSLEIKEWICLSAPKMICDSANKCSRQTETVSQHALGSMSAPNRHPNRFFELPMFVYFACHPVNIFS